MLKKLERDPERATRRSIPDPITRARTLADPEAGPLFKALTASTMDRMRFRLPGTQNDISVTRRTEYPLEARKTPTLVVHGTDDLIVPFAPHAKNFKLRVPQAELLTAHGGGHACIFTHRAVIQSRIQQFLHAHVPRKIQ